MRDSVVQVTAAGFIGAVVMDVFMYLILLLGVKITSPWYVAADVFLTPKYINTISGVIIGLIGTLALSIAGAVIMYLIFKITGYDYAVLKGVLSVNAFTFVAMGLFMPLLKIAPQIQSQPVTNFLALLALTITGSVMAFVLKKFHEKDLAVQE